MTNPFDLSSQPSQDKTPQQDSSASEDFSIRTMKEDLLGLQKGELPKKELLETQDVKSFSTMPTLPPSNQAPLQSPITNSAPIPPIQTKPESILKPNNTVPLKTPISAPTAAPVSASLEKQPFQPKKDMGNPFFTQTVPPIQSQKKDVVEIPLPEKTASHSKIYLAVGLFIISIVVIGLGGYYFWMTRMSQQTPPQPTEAVQEEKPVVVAPPTEKYSQNKPNYLILDLARINSDDIAGSLLNVANELKNKAPLSPYEFIAVDANNNPIAFPIFATAAKLTLSPTLLENLGEDFSLFYYNDGGNVRIALVANIKNKAVVSTELLDQESTFILAAQPLFLGSVPKINSGTFSNGSYDSLSTRYLNLDSNGSLSIDYAVINSKLAIGTSKNTLRAVLDKLTGKTTTINTQSPSSIETPATTPNDSPSPANNESPTTLENNSTGASAEDIAAKKAALLNLPNAN